MSVTTRINSGDLCSVRLPLGPRCGGLQVTIADVPLDDGGTVEIALCENHYAELHAAADPIAVARGWVA